MNGNNSTNKTMTIILKQNQQIKPHTEWITKETMRREIQEWKNILQEGTYHLQLPCDSSRIHNNNNKTYSYIDFTISEEKYNILKQKVASYNTEMYTFLTSAYFVLLYRYTRQNDITIGFGTPVFKDLDNKQSKKFYFNTLPLTAPVSENSELSDFMQNIGKKIKTVLDNRSVLISDVIEEIGKKGSPSLAQSTVTICFSDMVYNNIVTDEIIEPNHYDYEISLIVASSGSGLTFRVRYNASLFNEKRIQIIGRQYLTVIEQFITSGRQSLKLNNIDLVTEADKSIIPDPTCTLEVPYMTPVPELFEAVALHNSDHTAIRQADRNWTYGELYKASKSIASEIVARKITAGDVVAVIGKRRFGTIASILGILMSGGVLLSIDPNFPTDRKNKMLQEAQAKLILFVGNQDKSIDEITKDRAFIRIDNETVIPSDDWPTEKTAIMLPKIKQDQPAYIFFTSGSTGVPKGVLGVHRGLAHFLSWQGHTFNVGKNDRHSQLTALSFDVVLRDILLPLTHGATLCLPDAMDEIQPRHIIAWLEKECITVVHTVPALAQTWIKDLPEGASLDSLRIVFFAGEPLTDTLVQEWRNCFPHTHLIVNLYGPTETTLAKCFFCIPENNYFPGIQPIGEAMPNTQVLILNKEKRLCAPLELGEITIRTPFRSLGYINNPESNLKLFKQNPYSKDVKDLVYFTGDIGRYRYDGLLEILGRVDNQVKIRGIRIEPGEIEKCLNMYPGISESLVVVREIDGEKVLIAYFVLKEKVREMNVPITTRSIRNFVANLLPNAMIPSRYITIDKFPLNPNGKIDRKSLLIEETNIPTGVDYIEPQTELQHRLKDIWASVLNNESFGIEDDFFDIGGHSLSAVHLLQKIKEEVNLPVTLPIIFQNTTIRKLSRALIENAGIGSESNVVLLQEKGDGPPLFCVVGVHLYNDLAQHFSPDYPVYGVILPYEEQFFNGKINFTPSVEKMATKYIQAIKRVKPEGPYCLAGVSFGGVLAYEIAQQLSRSGEHICFVALFDSLLPGAIRRNYLKWMGEHIKNVFFQGPIYLFQKVNNRISKIKKYVLKSKISSDYNDTTSLDFHRFDQIRAKIYKHATENYRIQPYQGIVLLFRAKDQNTFVSDLKDPSYGWARFVTELYEFDVPGDHISMLEGPNSFEVARRMRRFLTS